MRAAKTEGGSGATLGKGPEQHAAAHLASGVLAGGEVEGPGQGPVAGDIVEVLDVGGDPLKDAPSGLDVGEVCVDICAGVFGAGHGARQMRSRAR